MPYTPLFAALAAEDLDQFCSLLSSNASPDTVQDGIPLIHAVALTGSTDFLDVLVKAGASVDIRNAKGQTALMTLAQLGWRDSHVLCIAKLIAAGADVNALDREQRTALDWATAFENGEMARRLLKAGARGSAAAVTFARRHAGERRDASR